MAKCCFSFTALPLAVIVGTICLFDNFEKLLLRGFARGILEGWARVCCVHVFLVLHKAKLSKSLKVKKEKTETLLDSDSVDVMLVTVNEN